MDLADMSVASLSAVLTAVAATAAWQAARVGLGPARLIALQLKDSDEGCQNPGSVRNPSFDTLQGR